MDPGFSDVLSRLDALGRELSELRLRVAALSADPRRSRRAVERYLALSDEVSRAWVGEPSVLEVFRKSRDHGV